ncbi:Insulin-induced protein 2 protein [Nymphon striatum]|nr:Insulin-induced protein 2 protein [Nymphon striatum]
MYELIGCAVITMVSMTTLFVRSAILFMVGASFTLVLKMIQIQRSVPVHIFPQEFQIALYNAWWILVTCGFASALVGYLFPCLDEKLGVRHTFKREWSSVMKCITLFVGIGHATAKVDFDNNMQLTLTLAAMSIGLWWFFDRSKNGLALGIFVAILATFITQILCNHEVFKYTEQDFMYVRSWLPCVFFSGGITVGNIGRQLAIVNENFHNDINNKTNKTSFSVFIIS